MNLHEYQAWALCQKYDVPTPKGKVIKCVEEVYAVTKELGDPPYMAKAQVHAGGRGKAGGVRYVTSKEQLVEIVKSLLGKRLVTYQTDAQGQPVNQIMITTPCDIERELYLGLVLDRATRSVVIMASTEGGVDIEQVAHETPEKILKMPVDPLLGILPWQAHWFGFQLKFNAEQRKSFTQILMGLGQLFTHYDLSIIEINPLIVNKQGGLVCLDAKVVVDDNALFRQPELRAMRDPTQEDARENRAHDCDLNYISLDGNIGCMVNGAGLAMATMDLIKLHGGSPANFLDVGGGATKERVSEAFKIILSDTNVKGVLVNIFGGIVRCDMIAEGIIAAVKEVGVQVPVVVRLEGNNADKGAKKLHESGLNIMAATSLTAAAQQIIDAVTV